VPEDDRSAPLFERVYGELSSLTTSTSYPASKVTRRLTSS
jgi:hypothetical protein